MTSLAGAVQSVDSGEMLESLRANKGGQVAGHDNIPRRVTAKGGTSPISGTTAKRAEPVFRRAIGTLPANTLYLTAKRATDIVGSLIALAFLSPLIALAAIIIKLSDGGPAFYPHTRVGKWGREFRCFKFRTMVVNADHLKPEIAHLNTHDDERTFKVPDDPRVTRVGWILRRTSLDEVPQLLNVLLGSMSLVGPRPPVVQEVERYNLDDMQRLMVKPGLTCIWQVSGRSRLPFTTQLDMDLAYIENRSYWLDLKLMVKTLPAVLSADGAY